MRCFRSSFRLAISAAFSSFVIGVAAGVCAALAAMELAVSTFPQSLASSQPVAVGVDRWLEGAGDTALCADFNFITVGGDSDEEALRVS